MRKRVTINDLREAAEHLNRLSGTPEKAMEDGVWNTGHFMIGAAYGGYSLQCVASPDGAIHYPAGDGHMPARELLAKIEAYANGYRRACAAAGITLAND